MTTPEAIDATAEEMTVEHHEPVAATSVALAPRERRSEVIRPLDADQLIESFQSYQNLLPRLLDASDYQSTGTDKNGVEKRFVKKSGWRKIATAFDLDVQLIRSTVERDENGQPLRAEVWARAIAPSGRVMDGDGYCSVEEERFGKPGEVDWKIAKARAKLENDLRATATTRAKNRAISDLVGMGEVSAEEVGGPQDHGRDAEASPDLKGLVRSVLGYLLDGNQASVNEALRGLSTQFEARTPASAAQAIVLVGSAVKRYRENGPPAKASDVDNRFAEAAAADEARASG